VKWVGLSIAVVAALARLVHADGNEADRLAGDAEALAKKNDFVGAAGKFKAAFAADPRPALICNVGVAYYKAKELARAHLFLNRCLERGTALDAKFVDNVRAVLKAVETSLRSGEFTPLDIVVEPASTTVVVQAFGDDEAFIGSRVVWLTSGKQTLVGRAEGYSDRIVEVDAKGHDLQPVRVALERKPVDTGTQTTTTTTGTTGIRTAPPPPPPQTETRYKTRSKVPAIAGTVVTVTALAFTIVAYGNAHDSAERSEFALTQSAYDADVRAVEKWNTIMGASATLSVIGAGLTGYLWSRAFTSERVEVQPTSGGIALRFTARW
jgi:hypothetical protein